MAFIGNYIILILFINQSADTASAVCSIRFTSFWFGSFDTVFNSNDDAFHKGYFDTD